MDDNTPIILVPGFMASSLGQTARFNFSTQNVVWPPNLYSLTSQLTALEETYPLQVTGLVEGYYQNLIDFITRPLEEGGLGRKLNEDFWIFAYDWRQSNRISGTKLHKFILEKIAIFNAQQLNKGQPTVQSVNIICHSMGGIVTRVAAKSFQAPVNRVVYIASGDYGIPKVFFALHPDTVPKLVDEFLSGFLSEWYWDLLKSLPNVWLLQNWLARILGTFQSMYEMLPDKFYFNTNQHIITDQGNKPVVGVEPTYFAGKWQLPAARLVRVRQAMNFKAVLGSDLPGQDNLIIYCDNLPTYTYANFNNHLEYPIKVESGDGTVTSYSISRDAQATRTRLMGSHSNLPNLEDTHKAIRKFLVL